MADLAPPKPKTPAVDPFGAVRALGGRAISSTVLPLLDALNRPSDAGIAAVSGLHGLLKDDPRGKSAAQLLAPHLGELGGAAWNAFTGKTPQAQRAATLSNFTAASRESSPMGPLLKHLPEPIQEAIVGTIYDPTTALGASGALEHGANVAGKTALYAGIKGATNAQRGLRAAALSKPGQKTLSTIAGHAVDPADIERAVTNTGKVGGAAFDFVTPRGGVTRKAIEHAPFDARAPLGSIDKPFADVDTLSSMRNRVVNTQRGITQAGQQLYDSAVNGLTADEKRTVFRAVEKGTTIALPPHLRDSATKIKQAYLSLLHLQGTGTVRRDLAGEGFQLPAELQPFDATRPRGIFNRSNRRANYLPHGQQFADADLADIRAESRPGLTEEDLLMTPRAGTDRATTMLDATDPHKIRREDISQLQDVGRQNEINRARFATAGRSIAARDASRELAKTFGTAKPVMRKVQGERADVGEVYRAAVSGLNDQDRRAVNLLINPDTAAAARQAGLSIPDFVAQRVGGAASKNLLQRAQSITDALAYRPEVREVPTAGKRYDLSTVPGYMREYFMRPPAPSKGPLATAGRAVRAVAQAPKFGFFFAPYAHQANITTLGALADPGAMALGAGRFALAHPEYAGTSAGAAVGGYEDGWQGALAGAATGFAAARALRNVTPVTRAARASEERAIDTARRAGALPINPEQQTPGLIRAIPGLRQAYEGSNRMLWGYDEAAKAARYDSLIRSGVSPAKAAQRVGADLVDYGNKSGMARALDYAAMFPAWRTKFPGAVARATVRHPERALAINRTAPAFAGSEQDAGNGQAVKGYGPLADFARMTNGPQGLAEFARGTAGWPTQDALSSLGVLDNVLGPHGMTYGKPVDARLLATQTVGTLPIGNQVLNASNMNAFSRGGPASLSGFAKDVVESQTRLRTVKKPNEVYARRHAIAELIRQRAPRFAHLSDAQLLRMEAQERR